VHRNAGEKVGIKRADLAATWENPAIAEAVDADRQAAQDPRNPRCSCTDFAEKYFTSGTQPYQRDKMGCGKSSSGSPLKRWVMRSFFKKIYDPCYRPRIAHYTAVPRPTQNNRLFRVLKVGAVERHDSIADNAR